MLTTLRLPRDYHVITSDSASGAERTLRQLQLYSEAVGLQLNAEETKDLRV